MSVSIVNGFTDRHYAYIVIDKVHILLADAHHPQRTNYHVAIGPVEHEMDGQSQKVEMATDYIVGQLAILA